MKIRRRKPFKWLEPSRLPWLLEKYCISNFLSLTLSDFAAMVNMSPSEFCLSQHLGISSTWVSTITSLPAPPHSHKQHHSVLLLLREQKETGDSCETLLFYKGNEERWVTPLSPAVSQTLAGCYCRAMSPQIRLQTLAPKPPSSVIQSGWCSWEPQRSQRTQTLLTSHCFCQFYRQPPSLSVYKKSNYMTSGLGLTEKRSCVSPRRSRPPETATPEYEACLCMSEQCSRNYWALVCVHKTNTFKSKHWLEKQSPTEHFWKLLCAPPARIEFSILTWSLEEKHYFCQPAGFLFQPARKQRLPSSDFFLSRNVEQLCLRLCSSV